jgi:homoserine kinase
VTASVSVRVPATSANLGPGFDCFGLALQRYDELTAEFTAEVPTPLDDPAPPGDSVDIEGEGAGHLPRDKRHLVLRALRQTLESYAHVAGAGNAPPVALQCRNRIPLGRGLGSSAAAIVAGVRLAEGLLGVDLGPDERLAIATSIEGHPDNVAACIRGGFTLAWIDGETPRAARLTPLAGLVATVFVPPGKLATKRARGLLPAQVPHADAATNAGRAALLVTALTQDPGLLHAATADLLHQYYRAADMPESYALMTRLRADGWAATISGAGPTVAVLHDRAAQPVPELPEGWVRETLEVDQTGATLVGRE